jgi:hypothetical protein
MANFEILSNGGITTVGTGFASPTSTLFTPAAIVGGLVGLTSGQQCRVTLGNVPSSFEIIIVVGPVSGGSFTCLRGQEGTASNQQAWGVGTQAICPMTAGSIQAAINQAIGAPSATVGGDLSGTVNSATVSSISGASGVVTVNANAFTYPSNVTAPTWTQTAPATDVATSSMNFTPQPANASAVTNVIPGSLNIKLTAPVSGTTEASFSVYRGATQMIVMQAVPGDGTGYSGIWLSPAGTISHSNATLWSGSSETIVNCTGSSGVVYLQNNGGTLASFSTANITTATNALIWGMQNTMAWSQTQNNVSGSTAGPVWSITPAQGSNNTTASGTAGAGSIFTINSGGGGNATGGGASVGGAGSNLVLNAAGGGPGTTPGANGSLLLQVAGTTYFGLSPLGTPTFTNATVTTSVTPGAVANVLLTGFLQITINGTTRYVPYI